MGKIEELQIERRKHEVAIERIDAVIAEFKAWEERASALLHGEQTSLSPMPLIARATLLSMPELDAQTPMREFTMAVLAILDRTDTPLDRSALLAQLEAGGVIVGGADPKSTLSARMTRMPDDVVNIRGYGFWRKSRPFPQGEYHPPTDTTTPSPHEVGEGGISAPKMSSSERGEAVGKFGDDE